MDYITGAPNIPLTEYSEQFSHWLSLRNYTMKYFDSKGLLENQLIIHKVLRNTLRNLSHRPRLFPPTLAMILTELNN